MESEPDQYLDESDNESDTEPELVDLIQQHDQRYIVLSEDDIRKRQEEDITKVSDVLSISREYAFILLKHFKWDTNKVNEKWFPNEEFLREDLGLQMEIPVETPTRQETECEICFQYPSTGICAAPCGHAYCFACWQGYIGASINDGPGCLNLRCPDPSCSVAITQDMINNLAKDEDKKKFARFALRSYVEDNKKAKWCPFPGCDFAVEFLSGSGNYDVSCNCSFSFCWNCTEEAHRPVDCDTVSKWINKDSVHIRDVENINWILANSKPCPKCKRAIEKDGGGIHITCIVPCKFEFCWLCLEAWDKHEEENIDYRCCTRYESGKKQEPYYNEADMRIEMASNSLDRYKLQCYKLWASFQSLMMPLGDLHEMKTKKIPKLSNNIREPETQLKFIIEAWQQIVECRRVLKWTYAYGYYLPENEDTKRQFLKNLQGDVESNLDRLHICAEKELWPFLCMDEDDFNHKMSEDFSAFRVKLAHLTNVTKKHLENLVHDLENGLEDVGSNGSTHFSALENGLVDDIANRSTRFSSIENGVENASSSGSTRIGAFKNGVKDVNSSGSTRFELDGVTDQWSCERCTFANPVTSDTCRVCAHRFQI